MEGFDGVLSYNTPMILPLRLILVFYHHKSLQYKSDTMNNAWEIQTYCVTCEITLIFVHFRAFIEH